MYIKIHGRILYLFLLKLPILDRIGYITFIFWFHIQPVHYSFNKHHYMHLKILYPSQINTILFQELLTVTTRTIQYVTKSGL